MTFTQMLSRSAPVGQNLSRQGHQLNLGEKSLLSVQL
jgi:hypothetical protein